VHPLLRRGGVSHGWGLPGRARRWPSTQQAPEAQPSALSRSPPSEQPVGCWPRWTARRGWWAGLGSMG